MPDRCSVIKALDAQIRKIEAAPERFPEWQDITVTMRNALELLMSYDEAERLEDLESRIREFRD